MKTIRSWYDISDEDPYELVGRFIENSLGIPEIVTIPRINWAYFDWLQYDQGRDLRAWVKKCDLTRLNSTETFSEILRDSLYEAYVYREELGDPRPPWLPPYDE